MMEKLAKNYIDDIAKPMLHRIETLERENEELRVRVKYLESLLLSGSRSYQKPTVSAANHMRDSKISSKGDKNDKRPGWDSKTKIDSPPANLSLGREHSDSPQEKPKAKPPVPRASRATSKSRDLRTSASKKGENMTQGRSGQRSSRAELVCDQPDSENPFQENVGLIRERPGEIGRLNYIFEQLVRTNTDILASMRGREGKAQQQ